MQFSEERKLSTLKWMDVYCFGSSTCYSIKKWNSHNQYLLQFWNNFNGESKFRHAFDWFGFINLVHFVIDSCRSILIKKYGILDLRHMVSETCKAWYGLCRIFVMLLYVHQHSNIFEHFQISTIVIPTHVKMEEPALMEWIRILAVALLVTQGSTARRVRGRRKQLYFADYSRHFGNGMHFPSAHWEVINGLGNVW